MPAEVRSLLQLEVPLIVELADRRMDLEQVVRLTPGSIIEFSKSADEPLTILVNNQPIGLGSAVKVGENYGIKVIQVGNVQQRFDAATGEHAPQPPSPTTTADSNGQTVGSS